jgi:lactoylglutathione lyase
MESPSLSLIVLRTTQLEAALAFYRALGLQFVEEPHGAGPVHFSTQLGGVVVEIYPGEPAAPLGRKAAGATMLGFQVPSVDTAVRSAKQTGAMVTTEPMDSDWGRRAVVIDPDGRAIELNEPKKQ